MVRAGCAYNFDDVEIIGEGRFLPIINPDGSEGRKWFHLCNNLECRKNSAANKGACPRITLLQSIDEYWYPKYTVCECTAGYYRAVPVRREQRRERTGAWRPVSRQEQEVRATLAKQTKRF